MGHKGIYQIRCVANGRIYVGASTNIGYRWQWHQSVLRRGRHTSRLLQEDWILHGPEAFQVTLLEAVSGPNVNSYLERERHWIAALKPQYNRETERQCNRCGRAYIGTPQGKFCSRACKAAAFHEQRKQQAT
jgi:group I intron endonuclease